MDLKNVIGNTKEIYMTDSSLNTILDFERVLDEVDMYAFKNWIKGELVQGPVMEKYWITCKFMYPYKLMPDPQGAVRLLDYNCKIKYEEDYLMYSKKVESPEDFEPGTKKPKKIKKKVWIVEIRMPKDLLTDIRKGYLELEGSKINMEDIDQAYDEVLNNTGAAEGTVQDNVDDDLGLGLDLGL